MTEIAGGEAVVRTLIAHGVDVVFGLIGVHALPVYDALYHHPEVRHISVRHEQTAAYMADAYARVSGRPGVCVTTTGPGAANTAAAMATAYHDSVPLLNIMPQVPSDIVGQAKGFLHEAKDQLAMFAALTKWNARVDRIEDIPAAVGEAFRQMATGRPRPVQVEICADLLAAGADGSAFARPEPVLSPLRREATAGAVEAAARLLRDAKSPLIWAGAGVERSRAWQELARLAESLQAPVVTTTQGAAAIPYDHPLALGYRPADGAVSALLERADLLLVVGSRLSAMQTANWSLKLPEMLVQIDADETEFGKNYLLALGLLGDAKAVLKQVLNALGGRVNEECWAGDVSAIRGGIAASLREESPAEMTLIDTIRAALGRDAVVVCDQTKPAYWAARVFPVYEPGGLLYPGFGTLGFGLPAALGAKVAAPERPVVLLVGDGGFQMSMPELATAVQHGINVTVLLFNDEAYGILRDIQDAGYGGRRYAVDLVNPDFRRIVEAYGLPFRSLDAPGEIAGALKDALASDRTSVIEIKTEFSRPRQF